MQAAQADCQICLVRINCTPSTQNKRFLIFQRGRLFLCPLVYTRSGFIQSFFFCSPQYLHLVITLYVVCSSCVNLVFSLFPFLPNLMDEGQDHVSSVLLFTSMFYWAVDKSGVFPCSPDRTSVSIRVYYWCSAVSVSLPLPLDCWEEASLCSLQSATLQICLYQLSCEARESCAVGESQGSLCTIFIKIFYMHLKKKKNQTYMAIFLNYCQLHNTGDWHIVLFSSLWHVGCNQSKVIRGEFMTCWQSA